MNKYKLTKGEFLTLKVEVFSYLDTDGKKYKGAICRLPRLGSSAFIDGYDIHTRDDIISRHLLDNILYYDVE